MDPKKYNENEFRENVLREQSDQAVRNNVPLSPKETDSAVRLFYRNKMFEQTKAIQKSMRAAIWCALFAGVSAVCAIASLLMLASKICSSSQ